MRAFLAAALLAAALIAADWLLRSAASSPSDLAVPDAPASVAEASEAPAETPTTKLALAEIRTAAAQGDYLGALRQLYELHHAVQDEVPPSLIREWIRRTVASYDEQLLAAGHRKQRLALYDFLVFQEPDSAGYFYRRAQVQSELGLDRDALASLDMAIHDSALGASARSLARRIRERANASAAAPDAPAPDAPPAPDTRAKVAATRRVGEQFVVAALLDGRHALNLIVDTGASLSAVSWIAARRIGLDLSRAERRAVSTAAGLVRAPVIDGRRLSVGGAAVDGVSIGVLPMAHAPGEVDGLLGMDYLGRFRFFLDQQGAELRLQPR